MQESGQSRWRAFARDFLLKGMGPALVIVAAVWLLEHNAAWFRAFDHAFLDTLTRFRVSLAGPPPSRGIFIVAITDDNYKDLFCSRSPLAADTVLQLIRAVQQLQPAVIGVDLDTRGDEWKRIPANAYRDVLTATNIVWAGVPDVIDPEAHGNVKLEIGCPLAGNLDPAIQSDRQIGITLLPQDDDGVVRRHRAEFDHVTLRCGGGGKLPSRAFDIAVFEQCKGPCAGHLGGERGLAATRSTVRSWLVGAGAWFGYYEREAPLYVSFSAHNPQIVQASEFLIAQPVQGSECPAAIPRPGATERLQRLVKDRVVLIGGMFGAARDDYVTPVGRMFGVQLFASGIQSAAAGFVLPGDWRPVEILRAAVDLSVAAVVVAITLLRKHRFSALVALLGLLVPLGLVFMLHDRSLWLGAAPVGVVAVLHALYEKFQAVRHERDEALRERDEARRERDALSAEVETKKNQLAAPDQALSAAPEQLALTGSPPEPPQSPSPPPDRSGSAPDAA